MKHFYNEALLPVMKTEEIEDTDLNRMTIIKQLIDSLRVKSPFDFKDLYVGTRLVFEFARLRNKISKK